MIKKLVGIVFICVCGACLFYGYQQYMDQTEGARVVDDFTQSSGLVDILPEDATKPEIPDETKFALVGAAITGLTGLVLVIRS